MSSETITETHKATGVTPVVSWRLRAISIRPKWQLAVTFNDGLAGIVDVSDLVQNADAGIFEALRDEDFFSRAYLDYGAITWPNGADLAPEVMYKEIRSSGIWHVPSEI